ncbi:DNA/RNA-binding protein KIN17 [Thalictrum thalictroides]|uniref:DNA/RNA-binding protein KIN17 n=1 Tax=Thalictrum thalictroides TaxID=46969 RepID=A0A7J6UT09_THATH|nr:DNA/RNA-binding protein KIN17 [Thalictrum thalictroides]
MGKNDFLTPKGKGLQKLKWYCQMCQKQCKDENGSSEGDQRQMEVFGQNPHTIVDWYSEEFEESFLKHMKQRHKFSRVAATVVYSEELETVIPQIGGLVKIVNGAYCGSKASEVDVCQYR